MAAAFGQKAAGTQETMAVLVSEGQMLALVWNSFILCNQQIPNACMEEAALGAVGRTKKTKT